MEYKLLLYLNSFSQVVYYLYISLTFNFPFLKVMKKEKKKLVSFSYACFATVQALPLHFKVLSSLFSLNKNGYLGKNESKKNIFLIE